MDIDLNELERLALDVGGDEWTFDVAIPESGFCAQVWDSDGQDILTSSATDRGSAAVAHAAAANPAVVLELVRRLREAEARVTELEAERAERERQEPDLYVQSNHFAQAKFSPFLARVCQQPIEGIATMPLYAAPPVASSSEPVFWYRPHSDGQGYDGPINDSQIEAVRRNSGAWVPLYAAQPVTAPVRLTDKQIAESHANEIMNCLQDPCDKSESVMPMPHDVNRFVRAIETAVLRANGFNIDHPEHALELVGLRGCNSRHGTHWGKDGDPCVYRMRSTDPGCTGCADRDEDQAAEAGG